jgi:hypothetical protein
MSPAYTTGPYRAEVIDHWFDHTARSVPFLAIQLRILAAGGSGHQSTPCPRLEREARYFLGTPVGADILLRDLRGLGIEVADIAGLHPDAAAPVSLVGRCRPCRCRVCSFFRKRSSLCG